MNPTTKTPIQENLIELDSNHIIKAFDIISSAVQDSNLISQADAYLSNCESNPNFLIALLDIFSSLSEPRLQWQILVHFKILLKRNWPSKRRYHEGVRLSEEIKDAVRAKLLILYQNFWKPFYKQFNQIFKVIAKDDYPSKYPSLKEMIVSMLSFLSAMPTEQMIDCQQLIPYLSLAKRVLKEMTQGRLIFSSTLFGDHIVGPLQHAKVIQQKINSALVIINQQNNINEDRASRLLESSRKIDKIILYSLTTITYQLQSLPEIASILELLIDKIQFLVQIREIPRFSILVQQNLSAIIESISKIQGMYPFAFTTFLRKYLETVINMLLNFKFRQEKLVNCVILANSKPLTTVAYYMSKDDYANSMYNKKNKNKSYVEEQMHCHQIFLQIYGGDNPSLYLQKILTQLLPMYARKYEEDELIFEDSQNIPEVTPEKNPFDLLLILFKNIIVRFFQATKIYINNIIAHLANSTTSISGDQARQYQLQVLTILPRTLEQTQINIQEILNLMHKMYILQDYKSFCRLVRHYESYLTPQALSRSFSILAQIICKPGVHHILVYQSAVCIKKILNNNEQSQLPMQCMGGCITNIFQLLSIYKENPNHLWNLLNLLAQITRCLSAQALMINMQVILNSIDEMIQRKDAKGLIVGGIAEMIEGIIEMVDICKIQIGLLHYMFQISTKHLSYHLGQPLQNDANEQDNTNSLFRLWLCLIKNYSKDNSDIGDKLSYLMSQYNGRLKMHDPIRFLQITEEYLISGLVQFSQADVNNIFQQLLEFCEPDLKDKVTLALFCFYYTYSCLTNTYIQEIIVHAIKTLKDLVLHVSSPANTKRSIIYMIISHHIILFGAEHILRVLGTPWPTYQDWFWPLVWSLDYLNQKYASKVIAMGLLSCIHLFPPNMLRDQISDDIPFLLILKFLLSQTQQIKWQQAINSYMNTIRISLQRDENISLKVKLRYLLVNRGTPRRIKIHVKQEWATMDLSEHLRQKIMQLKQSWGQELNVLTDKLDCLSREKLRDLMEPPTGQ